MTNKVNDYLFIISAISFIVFSILVVNLFGGWWIKLSQYSIILYLWGISIFISLYTSQK